MKTLFYHKKLAIVFVKEGANKSAMNELSFKPPIILGSKFIDVFAIG